MEIFLVEDSKMVRERLEAMFAGVPGANVVGHAGGASEAVRSILEKRPDLVVLDVQLAEGSGFDVLRELHARAPELDVYMLTNYSADPYRQIAGRFGARRFFDKTREFERVRDAVAERAARLI
jgi:DNA-binding NarL/FixJ family response regulator